MSFRGLRLSNPVLFFLNRLEKLAEVFDALADGGFVVVLQVLENGSPHWHVGGTVRREARPESKNHCDVVYRELSAMIFCECCEVRWLPVE